MTQIAKTYERGTAENPDSLVILLHGLGSNGQDLISLAPLWMPALPQTVFVSPDAPFPCDMVPPGYPDSYQWFSLQSRDPKHLLRGVKEAGPILESFIKEQMEKYAVPPEKTALVGFSQGTMMSLHVGLHLGQRLAGILGYSGALVDGRDVRTDVPVRLIHGQADDVVPLAAYEHAKTALEEAGVSVSGHTTPGLAHSIDEAGLQSGGAFLQKVLYETPRAV